MQVVISSFQMWSDILQLYLFLTFYGHIHQVYLVLRLKAKMNMAKMSTR